MQTFKRSIGRLAIAAILGVAANAAHSAAVAPTVVFSAGTSFNTTGLDTFTTGADDMAGMAVRVTYGDGTTEDKIWMTTGIDTGGATGSDWSLTMSGSTSFSAPWVFTYSGDSNDSGIKRLSINGRPGDTVFDAILDPMNTPDSARGGSVGDNANGTTVDAPAATAVTATYSDRLLLNNVFYDDLYTVLTFDFDEFLDLDSSFTFTSDTDNVKVAGDITQVPEPASLALFGLGMLAMVASGRRTRRT